MQKHHYSKIGLIACIAVFAASLQVRADMAEASGILADIFVAATQASTDWAKAGSAKPFDGEKVAKAEADMKTVDDAIAAALEAYAALETPGGDDDADMQKLRNARQLALGEDTPPSASIEDFTPFPNIDAVPWETDGLKNLHNKLYQIKKSASAEGGSDFAERDFTDI